MAADAIKCKTIMDKAKNNPGKFFKHALYSFYYKR
jgi:hypothetical protein